MTRDPEQLALRAAKWFVVALLALTVFLALVVPFHATDALVYGQFSQLIGRDGGFLFDQVGYPNYARPLFYAVEGWLWWLFGAHEWIGRLLSLAFFVLLLWSMYRIVRDRALPPAAPWLTLLLLIACPDVVQQALAGQTDVPVAALVAAAAVLAWRFPPSWRIGAAVAVVACAAVLTKATALPALAGLVLACLIGDRAGLGVRLRFQVLPLALGTAAGLVYAWAMARHFDMALNEFLGGVVNTTPDPGAAPAPADGGPAPGAQVTGEAVGGSAPTEGTPVSPIGRIGNALEDFGQTVRPRVLLSFEWLGPYVRLPALFAVLYGAARVVRVPHRAASLGALAVALVAFWVGPPLLDQGAALDAGAGAVLGSLLLVAPLLAVAWCPAQLRVPTVFLARLLVWAVVPLTAWALFGIIDDTRTVSPAWPALFALTGVVLAMGVAALRVRRAWAAAAAIVLVLGLAVLDLRNLDALGSRPDGSINSVRALRDLTPGTWLDPTEARIAADPQLGGMVADVRSALAAGGRLATNDGRLGFYWIERTTVGPLPETCADLRGNDVLAVLLNGAEPFDPAGFDCLEAVREVPGSYAVYRVSNPSS